MQYHVVFDAAQNGYRYWWFPAIGIAMFIFGYVNFQLQKKRLESKNPRFFRYSTRFFFGFALFWTVIALIGTLYSSIKLRNALNSNHYTLVQGRVTQFVPMPYGGHAQESFVVDGHRYQYSDYEVSSSFNNTQSHGGPIKEGLQVRIADVDGKIARLEIAN